MPEKATPYPKETLFPTPETRTFSGCNLLQIAMPLGGIGAGCICLNGQGGLQDFSIRNQPSLSAAPDRHIPQDCAFAVLYFPRLGKARLVEGPLPQERVYSQGLKAQGFRQGGHEGFPRFRECSFRGEYPFGAVELSDPDLPLGVTITGWSPFIPLDDRASCMPCLALEYRLHNPGTQSVPYEFSFHLSHLAHDGSGSNFSKTRSEAVPGLGALMNNCEDPGSIVWGSCALGVIGHQPLIKAEWFRGGWFDALSALWRELSTGSFSPNTSSHQAELGRNGASILMKGMLEPGKSIIYPIIISWYFPNVDYAFGQQKSAEDSSVHTNTEHGGVCGCGGSCSPATRWRTYYGGVWSDAKDVLLDICRNYTSLRTRTQAFHDALFRSSLPPYVLDAISANLAILKSPTVLRQKNGNVWAWEGCFDDCGCCHGTCTHVWNYAQALPHLFPALERTLREQELERSMDERGHVSFRAALPDGPTNHAFHAAADGQLGGIMKLYREWQISGDRDWLECLLPLAVCSLEYCIQQWDPEERGALFEPHHNTYDIEFWGPDGMCTSFYLGALAAMAQMLEDAGQSERAVRYRELAARGAKFSDDELFNGEYYQQRVTLEGLQASPSRGEIDQLRNENPAAHDLLLREGPKYQYGSGCLSDGVFGAWLAALCGVQTPQNRENIRRNLASIFSYNFKPSLWEHANPQRSGYAIGDEPGLLLCTWPRGGKPTLPFVYSDEVWTGIEYQVASHMIAEGLVDEGLTVVQAVRSRYDGRSRNPWNEYECGSYYARALASYGLLQALSGFRYSAPEKTLYLAPQLGQRPFECFFSTAAAWGTVILKKDSLEVDIAEGSLEIESLVLERGRKIQRYPVCITVNAGRSVLWKDSNQEGDGYSSQR